VTLLLALWMAFGDIAAVKAQPDLDKRSELALLNADHDLDEARQAYSGANLEAAQAAISELTESIDLCYDALQHSRTPPRRSKYYKRAELKVNALIRRLSGFRDEVSYDARPFVDSALKKLSEVHDQLIADIMSKKK
jgi:predicted P-loop ATPase/GTPase